MAEQDPPISRLGLHIGPEVKQLLADFMSQHKRLRDEVEKLGESFLASLGKILEITELQPGERADLLNQQPD